MDRQRLQYLFVYGTLRRDGQHEMYRLLSRYADFVGKATYRGRLYLIDDFPGATPSSDPSDIVRGEVYRLESPKLLLDRLDEYEEYDPKAPDRSLYRRELAEVRVNDGRRLRAWIYLYNRPTERLRSIPSGDFVDVQRPKEGLA